MYATCLYCHADLGRNDVVEPFPVGRRLAFDASKGRLWVICACGRWNLSPLDERWEAIEACERSYRGTRVRISTPNIGLARLPEGLELVRIGAPLRPEFAAWRYGSRFLGRRRATQLVAGASAAVAVATAVAVVPVVAPAITFGSIAVLAVPGVTTVFGALPVLGTLAAREYLTHDRVVAQLPGPSGGVLTVRAKHIPDAELHVDGRGGVPTLDVPFDGGWAHFSGSAAIQTTAILLAGANRFGATSEEVRSAVRHIEEHGDAGSYLARSSWIGKSRRFRTFSLLNEYRRLGALQLVGVERLALEMAVHEETERRAMEGELALLEDAWRDAERIAGIADGLLE